MGGSARRSTRRLPVRTRSAQMVWVSCHALPLQYRPVSAHRTPVCTPAAVHPHPDPSPSAGGGSGEARASSHDPAAAEMIPGVGWCRVVS